MPESREGAAPEPGASTPGRTQRRFTFRENRLGIQYMVAAMACFIINDVLVKYVSETLPAAQLIFVRGVMATVMIGVVVYLWGATTRVLDAARGWVAVRACIDAVATFLYLISLFQLPIANATAINLAAPLFIVAMAVPLLGERVDALRWVGVGAGFLGVLLVIQPRADDFNVYSLVALAATLLHAARDLLTRRISLGVPPIVVTFSTAVAVTALAGLLTLGHGWVPISHLQIALLGCAAVFLSVGYHLVIRATQVGELSVTAPFRYTGLIWALVLGYFIWGDIPNTLAWVGIVLLIAAGIHSIQRERRLATRA